MITTITSFNQYLPDLGGTVFVVKDKELRPKLSDKAQPCEILQQRVEPDP